jgi:23S rRNA (cytosine1962-C5)-methyltransferase
VYYCDLLLKVRLTDFGHLGFFAEHGPHWQWLRQYLQASGRPIRLLNAFAYTGGMSLAAAAAGASVVHLDAADNMVAWARDNAQLCGLAAAVKARSGSWNATCRPCLTSAGSSSAASRCVSC